MGLRESNGAERSQCAGPPCILYIFCSKPCIWECAGSKRLINKARNGLHLLVQPVHLCKLGIVHGLVA